MGTALLRDQLVSALFAQPTGVVVNDEEEAPSLCERVTL
jgi:hypothetical protein